MTGRIIRGRGSFYTVIGDDGNEYVLRVRKRFRHVHITPLVGDKVSFSPASESEKDDDGWMDEILPRYSVCFRPPVANITMLCVTIAVKPEPDWLLVDKMLAYAEEQKLKACLIVNKCDLDVRIGEQANSDYRNAGIQVFSVSALNGEGTDELISVLKGEICCFTGQSGVGKSSLLNYLCGLDLDTGIISSRIERGKNTTRHSELFLCDGFAVMDTPGFSLFDTFSKPKDPYELQTCYPDFKPYIGLCRFQPCMHDKEPDCAVRNAVAEGRLSAERVSRYTELLHITKERWRNRYD